MLNNETKEYIDERVDEKVGESTARQWGTIKEDLNDKFQILKEGQEMILDSLNRFKDETKENFRRLGVF